MDERAVSVSALYWAVNGRAILTPSADGSFGVATATFATAAVVLSSTVSGVELGRARRVDAAYQASKQTNSSVLPSLLRMPNHIGRKQGMRRLTGELDDATAITSLRPSQANRAPKVARHLTLSSRGVGAERAHATGVFAAWRRMGQHKHTWSVRCEGCLCCYSPCADIGVLLTRKDHAVVCFRVDVYRVVPMCIKYKAAT